MNKGSVHRPAGKVKEGLPEEATDPGRRVAELDTEHTRVGQTRIELELLAYAAIEEMPDGVMLVSMDGKLAYVNRACEELLGYKADELLGRSALELPTYSESKDRKKARETLKRVIKGGAVEPIDMGIITKDGREIPVSFTASVIRDAHGSPKTLVAVIRNITERKQAEDALRESEEQYTALVGSLTDAVFKFTDMEVTWCNESVEDIYGYTREELVGKDVSFLQPLGIDSTAFNRRIAAAIKQQGRFYDVASVRKKDGGVVYIEYAISKVKHAGGKHHPVELVAVARDVSDRKGMEEALRESEELSRGMLDTAATGIYLLQDGYFEYINRLFEEISGYKSDELVGTYSLDYVHQDDREAVRTKAIEVLKRRRSLPYEFRFIKKDSEIIWVLDRLTSIQYKGKRSVLGTIMDITERKRIETEVLDYTKQMETIYSIGSVVSGTLNLTELLNSVLDRVLEAIEVEAGGVFLLSKQTDELTLKVYKGVSAKFVKKVERLRVGEGFTGEAALSRKPLIVEDISIDPRLGRMGANEEGLKSFAAMPIRAKDRILGILGIGSYKLHRFPDRDVQLLRAIADQMGMAIENAQLYEQALELAFTDGLTGLYNRRYLMEQIERELTRAERNKSTLSLMMIDLDGLKSINDSYGHHEGDAVLKELGGIIKENTRASDVAARWGGDEFMLLTPETGSKGARMIGERIRSQVEQYRLRLDGEQEGITISIGIASYPGQASNITQLLQKVDEAMYGAKKGGRNQISVFSHRKSGR